VREDSSTWRWRHSSFLCRSATEMRSLRLDALFAALFVANVNPAYAQFPAAPEFQQTLDVGITDPVTLDVDLSKGDVVIGYRLDGQVFVSVWAKDASGHGLSDEFLKTHLVVKQDGSHVAIRDAFESSAVAVSNVSYRIDVPYRTEVNSAVRGVGKQQVIGVTGPVTLSTNLGDIDVTFVRFAPVRATTIKGKITCTRVLSLSAETGEGSITLLEDGDSSAVVRKGLGRIEIAGARGTVTGVTDRGDLHIKAIPHGNWDFKSTSGNIRIELPPKSNFKFDASAPQGEFSIERDDMQEPPAYAHEIHQQVNGGGKLVHALSASGNIIVQ
jgi:hypothetical protein